MAVFVEGDLQIAIDDALNPRRFDDSDSHGLSHCMKAVDFIAELSRAYLFIEFKDPQHPMSRPENLHTFLRDFRSGQIDEDLKYKYRDSFLYEWASGRADKPVHYYVLIAYDGLTESELQFRTYELERKLPVAGPDSWTRAIAGLCRVFNLRLWNRYLPNFPVARRSARP